MRFAKLAKEVILENWGLKLIALILAFFLWLFVHGDTGVERVISVPLDVRVPRNMEITNERPSFVEVTVRGSSSNIWFGQLLPTCIVDLQTAEEGAHVVPLTLENIRLPRTSDLVLVAIRPARINIVLERTVSKEVPVVVPVAGDPARGYDLYSRSASPSSVIITGPRSHVEKIQEVPTEEVVLSGRESSMTAYLDLNINDNLIHASPLGPFKVDIVLGVHRRLHTITGVRVEPDDKNVVVSPPRITIQVLVPETFKRSLTAADVDATVSVLSLGTSETPVSAKPDIRFSTVIPDMAIKDIKPSTVTVRRTGKS